MLRIKDFKFKNKEELDFAVAPECEYGCGEKMSIISNKDDITQIAVNIMGEYQCPATVGLIVHKSKTCEVITPTEDGKFQVSVVHLKDVLKTFRDFVYECDFRHLVLLEQYDEESYKIIE